MTEMGFKPSVTPTLTSFPNALLSNILTHVKVQSTLRLNMKRLPSETEQFFLIITAINNAFLTFPLSFKPPPRQLLWTQNLYIQLPLLDVWKKGNYNIRPKTNQHSFSENSVLANITNLSKCWHLPLLHRHSPPSPHNCQLFYHFISKISQNHIFSTSITKSQATPLSCCFGDSPSLPSGVWPLLSPI